MNRRTLAGTTAVLAILGVVTACQPTKTPGSNGNTSAATATSGSDSKTATKKTVPNFVGMSLQSAQDTAQEAGFYSLKSHDALGRARMQILDRDWKVCSQNVKVGTTASTNTELDFGAVKLAETCPSKDQAAPSAADGKMPDFRGKSVKAARAALDSGTSITVNDVSGDDRMVLIESNWQVCSQKPSAGAALKRQPVTLDAVKYGENCP
ncbi:PASTA domain-containing protein [Streptomyces olivochromogenes]|uniref:PASTA domain-containing protein n=1 Tax=Streptomyces olivochromogenes TaxID=1963 RepID=UPI001F266F1C|nr:PASTA domain-containing protein [Streptomyces olivochromogenes]MCF3132637.1 PASTA domain-containing protein [Streptomyces olivochromogenes]